MLFSVSDITYSTVDFEIEPKDTGAASTSGIVTAASKDVGNPRV